MPANFGKFICPDCRKDLGKSVARDSSLCSSCGKRICNYCHVAQGNQCRPCKTYGTKAKESKSAAKATAKKKKRFLIF